MNRKVIKIVSILLMILMIIATLSTSVFADEIKLSSFKADDNSKASESITSVIAALISVVQVVGMGVAIIMLVMMAIKYISAAPSEKAEIKKGATIYIVGAIILFAASGILGIIKNFAESNVKDKSSTTGSIVRVIDADTYLG